MEYGFSVYQIIYEQYHEGHQLKALFSLHNRLYLKKLLISGIILFTRTFIHALDVEAILIRWLISATLQIPSPSSSYKSILPF